jgi:hypothetical protein
MNIKKNDFMGDIYTSYGPFVGKICENTNTLLSKDNIIESLTSSISENSLGENSLNAKYQNIAEIDYNKYSPKEPTQSNNANTFKTPKTIKTPKTSKQNNIIFCDNLKTGGEVNKTEVSKMETEPLINNTLNEETGFFNYKVMIFNHKISIWILILILLVVICIGYFIYKYWYYKNTNMITYVKNDKNLEKMSSNDLSNDLSDNSSNDSSDDSSNSSDLSNNSSNNNPNKK